MDATNLEALKYPIGKYRAPSQIDKSQREEWIAAIAEFPTDLAASIRTLDEVQLDTPYRPDGWTVRQVVHHVADSHMNSVVRFRWALTEDVPLIKAYDEKLWAELADARKLSPQVSIDLLRALHQRWVTLLNDMSNDDFQRRLRHPASGETSLEKMVGLYAWHGRHHLAHINNLKSRMGWA